MTKHTHRIVSLSSLLLAPLLALGCGQGGGDDLVSLHQAATIQVPDDYASIQAAVDAAADGDRIEVAPGNYEEDVVVYGKAVELIGDAAQRPRLFGSLYFSSADFSVLRRFEVVGPGGFSSGVRAYASSITIEAVQVSNHDTGLSFAVAGTGDTRIARVVATGCGRGFVIENGAAVELANCLALFNSEDGVRVTASASATVVHCDAVGNGAYQSGDAGLSCAGVCQLYNNIAVNNDVGLSCSGDCDADHNLVWGNWLNYGAGANAGPNDLSTDPRFSNPAEYDFHLQETSPAIDAGGAPSAAADFDGVPRPQAEAVDIGAYEYRLLASELTLAINEVMANPLDEATGEFVELYNYGDAAVDAAGLIVWDGDNTDALAGYQGGSTSIPAGGYALVLDPDYADEYSIDAGVRLLTVGDTAIGNGLSTSDPISLWEPNGVTPIDRFSFPSNPGNGVSIEKVSIEEGDVLSNWKSSPCSASPGAENCASQPGNVAREVLIAVNEVMANPLDEATGEFVELYNFGDESVDLAGFVLSDGDSTDALVGFDGGGTVLLPGDYALIVDPDYAGQYDVPGSTLLLTAESSATLGNGLSVSDPISLLDASGQSVVDAFSRPFDPGNGVSIEKVDATVGDVPANWVTSTCAGGSSPGAVNCAAGGTPVAGDTIAITEVMANALDEDSGEYVELYNYGQDAVDVLGWHIDDGDAVDTIEGLAGGTTIIPAGGWALVLDREYAEDYNLPGGVVLLTTDDTTIGSGLATTDALTLRSAVGSAVVDAMSFPFNPGNGISVEKVDLVVGDVPQNWVASPCNHSPGEINCAMGGGSEAELSATFIVLSEVMANPLDEASGEYLELFNAGANAVDVGGWVVSDGDSTDTILGNGGGTSIQPGQYAVVQDPDYAGDYVIPAEALLLTVGSGTLGNSLSTNDPITLYEGDGTTVVDTFSFPTNPGNGVAMEKRTLTGGDEQTNWAASTCRTPNADNDYASPGARNCADWGNGLTGDQVVGEPCPYGAVDCLSGLCLVDLYTLETYCSEACPGGSGCQGGFTCTVIEDIWGTGATEVCVRD
jgi:hypothetical protein